MCLCLSVALIFPTGRPVQSPPDVSRRVQEPRCVAVTVCSRLCSWEGAHVLSSCFSLSGAPSCTILLEVCPPLHRLE